MTDPRYKTGDLSKIGVDIHPSGASAFVRPDFSTARRSPEGVLSWSPPSLNGLFGGIAVQDAPGNHAGERHLDGEELLVALSGALRIVLLDEGGQLVDEVRLAENHAFLVPQGAWHRVVPEGLCRFLFMGGGRTEIRQRNQ